MIEEIVGINLDCDIKLLWFASWNIGLAIAVFIEAKALREICTFLVLVLLQSPFTADA